MAYNGWTNRETWLVNLWIGYNLEEYKNEGQEITEDFVKQFVYQIIDFDVFSVENVFLSDLVNSTLDDVNWREIANCYKES